MDEATANRIATALESIATSLGRVTDDTAELRAFGEEVRPHIGPLFARIRGIVDSNAPKIALAYRLAGRKP